MAIERTFHCDGPAEPGSDEDRCPVHASTATPPPHLPVGIIEVRLRDSGGEEVHHFCGWDCLMKFAANQPIPERIDLDAGGSDAKT